MKKAVLREILKTKEAKPAEEKKVVKPEKTTEKKSEE